MDIKRAPTSVVDIWLDITSVGINCGTGAEICGSKGLLAQDRRLLHIFGRGACWFGIFGSGLTSVGDVDSPNSSPGVHMPCGYTGIRYTA